MRSVLKGRASMKIVIMSILVILSLFSSAYLAAAERYGTVEYVIDSDTVVIDGVTVRLIGIDTPETRHPSKTVQCFGEEASAYARERLEGKRVKYAGDGEGEGRDKYGRLLAYVYDDEGLFNADMVRKGYAFAYVRFPFKYRDRFVKYEIEAMNRKLGLWGACGVICDGSRCATNAASRRIAPNGL